MIHLRMNATEGWMSVTDALDYLWHKIYSCDPPEIDWSKRLPRSVFIKAYWPPAVKDREEFVGIHLDNRHCVQAILCTSNIVYMQCCVQATPCASNTDCRACTMNGQAGN